MRETSVRETPVTIRAWNFPQDCQWGNLDRLPGRCLMQSVSDSNQFLQWQGSLYWGWISIVAVLHKGCIAHIAHTWLSQVTNLASSLKTMSQLQFWAGDKWNRQNNKSFFAVKNLTEEVHILFRSIESANQPSPMEKSSTTTLHYIMQNDSACVLTPPPPAVRQLPVMYLVPNPKVNLS